jgi:predicted enzyme related to lactoylglutathione lyase
MSVSLLLRCNNIEETRAFYTSVLGFAVSASAEGSLTAAKYGGKLVFTAQDLWKSGPVCSGTIYFTVPDVDDCYAAIKDKAAIAWPLQDMSYGSREFGVTDCNGYTLAFQQQA